MKGRHKDEDKRTREEKVCFEVLVKLYRMLKEKINHMMWFHTDG